MSLKDAQMTHRILEVVMTMLLIVLIGTALIAATGCAPEEAELGARPGAVATPFEGLDDTGLEEDTGEEPVEGLIAEWVLPRETRFAWDTMPNLYLRGNAEVTRLSIYLVDKSGQTWTTRLGWMRIETSDGHVDTLPVNDVWCGSGGNCTANWLYSMVNVDGWLDIDFDLLDEVEEMSELQDDEPDPMMVLAIIDWVADDGTEGQIETEARFTIIP